MKKLKDILGDLNPSMVSLKKVYGSGKKVSLEKWPATEVVSSAPLMALGVSYTKDRDSTFMVLYP